MKKILMGIALFVAAAVAVKAQDVPAEQPFNDLYAAGVSFNYSATPKVAGTALYAHRLTTTDQNTGEVKDTGTYAFTVFDALPTSVKPFDVVTNVGVGIAQKVYTAGKYPIYIPTSANIAWKGDNVGWGYNFGAMTKFELKNGLLIMPTARFQKSSVSDGSGIQPIVGVLIGFGKR